MSESPTARTKRHLRKKGWFVDIAERWVPFHGKRDEEGDDSKRPAGIRKDLFGLFDLVAIPPPGFYFIAGVQCTTESNRRSRMVKFNTHTKECVTEQHTSHGEDDGPESLKCPACNFLRWHTRGARAYIITWKAVPAGKIRRWSHRVFLVDLDGETVVYPEVTRRTQ